MARERRNRCTGALPCTAHPRADWSRRRAPFIHPDGTENPLALSNKSSFSPGSGPVEMGSGPEN